MNMSRNNAVVVAACLIASTAMLVGDGALRWVLLGVAGLLGVVLALRVLRSK